MHIVHNIENDSDHIENDSDHIENGDTAKDVLKVLPTVSDGRAEWMEKQEAWGAVKTELPDASDRKIQAAWKEVEANGYLTYLEEPRPGTNALKRYARSIKGQHFLDLLLHKKPIHKYL